MNLSIQKQCWEIDEIRYSYPCTIREILSSGWIIFCFLGKAVAYTHHKCTMHLTHINLWVYAKMEKRYW